MTLCPIAVVAGCRKCPAFSLCPLKGVIGDHKAQNDAPSASPNAARREPRIPKSGTRKR